MRERATTLRKRIPFHTDAVQAPNLDARTVDDLGVDLLSLAAHKFRGPKGMGMLYIRRGVPFLAQQNGGGQERQRRAGTENVAGIVGTAEALRLAQQDRSTPSARASRRCRDRLRDGILRSIPDSHRPTAIDERAPREQRQHQLRRRRCAATCSPASTRAGIACSAGAACGATTLEPSHVLLAIGLPLERAVATLRFSLGHETTAADIDCVLRVAGADRAAVARCAPRPRHLIAPFASTAIIAL